MTGCEVRVEAWLRGYLPEGPVESFTPQQRRVYGLAGAWRECFESYGEEHGATLGVLLDLVCEAWPECDISIHYCHQRDAPPAPVIEIRASDLSDRDDHWEIWDADTVVAGLVAALEAAP